MCGRYTLTDPDPARIRARFGLDESAELERGAALQHRPHRSGAGDPPRPSGGERELGRLRWGLVPGPLGRAALGPAADQRPRRDAPAPARLRRVVPRAPLPDPRRRLLRVARRRARARRRSGSAAPDGELFAFAGIWAALPARDGSGDLHSCAIVTCEPNELIRPIHDRMPVVLHAGRRGAVARARARGGGAAVAAGAGAGGAARRCARSATRSTTSARTARTCSSPREAQPQLF